MLEIRSNGSKWYGQQHDTIEKLIEVLKSNTIEERFFYKYRHRTGEHTYEWVNLCPIDIVDGVHHFFGNFEEVSHVFNIETDEQPIIEQLVDAIKNNKGWINYYQKNLVTNADNNRQ